MKGTLLLDRFYHVKHPHPISRKKEFRVPSAPVDLASVNYEHSSNNNKKMQSIKNKQPEFCIKQDEFTLNEPSYFDLYPDLDDLKIEPINIKSRWIGIFERFNLSLSKTNSKD